MSGRMARNKGARGEREAIALLAGWLTEVVPDRCPELKRNLMQSREGGHDLVGLDWLAVEVKRHETLSVGSWWKQTVAQADRLGAVPFLMYRQNRTPWRFRIRLPVVYGGQATGLLAADVDAASAKIWLQHEFYYRCVADPDVV